MFPHNTLFRHRFVCFRAISRHFKKAFRRQLGRSLGAASRLGALQACLSMHLFMERHNTMPLHPNPSRQPLVLKRAARCAQRCQKFFGALIVPELIQCTRAPKIFATNRQSPSLIRSGLLLAALVAARVARNPQQKRLHLRSAVFLGAPHCHSAACASRILAAASFDCFRVNSECS